jgi:hypothetical protein
MAVTEGETLKPLTPEQDRADSDHGFERRLGKREHPIDPD